MTPEEKLMDLYRLRGYTDGQARAAAKEFIAEITGDLNLQIDAWKRYHALLSEELESLVGIAYIHGWSSTLERIEAGKKLRAELGIPDNIEKRKDDNGDDCSVCGWNGDRDEADHDGAPPATWSRSMHETSDGKPVCSHCQS